MIRLATVEDAPYILSIYTPYIETPITFENEVPSLKNFEERIKHYTHTYPWLVLIDEGKLAGYAYASPYRERIAYQWSIECSVYVNPSHQGKGVASSLYLKLFEILKFQGFKTVYAIITLPNEKSINLHERMGFKHFATYDNVGYKLGSWHNVGWWQLQLNEYNNIPTAPIPFHKLTDQQISLLLGR